jgi:predicted nucleic acid-binding protein
MALILFDTNILVYAHDDAEPSRRARAIAALDRVHASGQGRLSTQVLAEFFSIVTRGKNPMLGPAAAARQVERLTRSWQVLDVTALIVLEALRGVTRHQMPYWDSQLWATARLNQIPAIFSEDFNTGATLEGVRFVNPLLEAFDVSAWA